MRVRMGIAALAVATIAAGCGSSATKTVTVASAPPPSTSTSVSSASVEKQSPATTTEDPAAASVISQALADIQPYPVYKVVDVAGALDSAAAIYTVTKRKGEAVDGVYSVSGSCDDFTIQTPTSDPEALSVYVCDASVVDPSYAICPPCKGSKHFKTTRGLFTWMSTGTNVFVRRYGANVYLVSYNQGATQPHEFRKVAASMGKALKGNGESS